MKSWSMIRLCELGIDEMTAKVHRSGVRSVEGLDGK